MNYNSQDTVPYSSDKKKQLTNPKSTQKTALYNEQFQFQVITQTTTVLSDEKTFYKVDIWVQNIFHGSQYSDSEIVLQRWPPDLLQVITDSFVCNFSYQYLSSSYSLKAAATKDKMKSTLKKVTVFPKLDAST